jgi:hypothetical protein
MVKQYKQPKEQEAENIQLNPVNFLADMVGSIETVTAVPTGKPTNFINQFKFYSNGSTYRLYIYNAKSDVWRYSSLT